MKKRNRGFASILLIVIVSSLMVVWYFITRNIDKTLLGAYNRANQIDSSVSIPADFNDWKTYTNLKYNYAFRYPEDLNFNTRPENSDPKKPDSNAVTISVTQTDFKGPVEDNILTMRVVSTEPDYNLQTNIKISNNDLDLQKVNTAQDKNTKYLIKLADGDFLEILTTSDASRKDLALQILSTFKFTDNEVSNQYEITEKDNGKTFQYSVTSRFSVVLDANKYPLNNISIICNPKENEIGYVSNLSVNGPDKYPIGFEAIGKATCIFKNGDFSVTINIQ